MDDHELMAMVKDGDEKAFRRIVERHNEQILNLCYRYLGNQEDAEEVAQDVFIRIYNAAGSYRPDAKLSTYLYRIAVNLSLNRIRDRKRKRFVSLEIFQHSRENNNTGEQPSNPEQLIEEKEKGQIIRKAIDSLPPNQKTAVILKRYQELSYEEIARVMNCSVSAVEARLHRAKLNLQQKLKPLMSV
jgi:RNA polymerase sigma-70 factor (ECF subfamily)